MTLRKGDNVTLKAGGRPEHARIEGGPRILSLYANKFPTGQHFTVTSPETTLGNVGVENGVGLVASIHRDQLRRVFRGGWTEGDHVRVEAVSVYGTVVDSEPVAAQIDRKETVAIRVDSVPPSAQNLSGLYPGALFYAEPEYITKAPTVQAPRSIALGGRGGQGGIAIGNGAVGGRGGNGGSATIIGTAVHEAAEVVEKPKSKPVYTDVTAESDWKTVQVGDIVTAEHKTRHVNGRRYPVGSNLGAEVAVSRTSEVVGHVGAKFWCELELGLSSYDAYKITKVLRLQKPKLLSERRRPIHFHVDRLVPKDHVWPATTRSFEARAYVELHHDGHYWLTVAEGERAGDRIRLKEGRDTLSYKAILAGLGGNARLTPGGFSRVPDYETAVKLSHDPE